MTTLNLVTDAWMPVPDDATCFSPEALMAGDHAALGFSQPDLNAACLELLVCMAQTATPPADEREWRSWMKDGAFPSDAAARLKRLAPAFNLQDDKRPFMQDPSLDPAKPRSIELLDATRSPENAVAEGRALFSQPDPMFRLEQQEAAARLWIYQSWSPISGRMRGSYRGHGPLSTLIRMPTLRQTVLANLLPAEDTDPLQWIGWGGPLSDEKSEPLIPHVNHLDPRSALWLTPRRTRLVLKGDHVVGFVSGTKRGQLEQTTPHPHSPGHMDKEKWVAAQGRVIGRGYPALLPLAWGPAKAKAKDVRPARVVQHYLDQWDSDFEGGTGARLWAYGYHVDNNVDGWNEAVAEAPLRPLGPEARARVDRVLEASEKVVNTLWRACYEVLKDDEPKRELRPGQKLPYETMRDRYHRATETAFWNVVAAAPDPGTAARAWWKAACDAADALLSEWISGFPENRLAGRVRAQAVLRTMRRKGDGLLKLETP